MARERRGILDTTNVAAIGTPMHLSAAEYDLEISTHGASGELRRGIPCPCARIDTRAPAVDCKACKGLGIAYPVELRESMVWLDSQRAAAFKRAAAGEMRAGTIQITLPSGVIPTTGDMIRPDSERHVVEELLWVQGSSRVTDASLRPRVSADQVPQARGVRKRERMLYAPSECEIEHVAYHHEGQLVSARPNHYQVDEDGRWTWHAGLGPQPGEAWSVRYLAPAAYVITDTMPAYRAEADEPMPHRATAIRFDRVKPEDLA